MPGSCQAKVISENQLTILFITSYGLQDFRHYGHVRAVSTSLSVRAVEDSASPPAGRRRRYNEAASADDAWLRRVPASTPADGLAGAKRGDHVSSERRPAAQAPDGYADRRPRRGGVRMARTAVCMVLLLACVALMARGQGDETPVGLRIEVDPGALTLEIGAAAQLSATVRDAGGAVLDDATVVYYSRARRSVSVTRTGRVEAYRAGEFTLIALVPSNPDDRSRRPDARARDRDPGDGAVAADRGGRLCRCPRDVLRGDPAAPRRGRYGHRRRPPRRCAGRVRHQ